MVKQKPQPRKPKDEVALDVRTDLVQAEDLLVSRWLEYCSLQGFPGVPFALTSKGRNRNLVQLSYSQTIHQYFNFIVTSVRGCNTELPKNFIMIF